MRLKHLLIINGIVMILSGIISIMGALFKLVVNHSLSLQENDLHNQFNGVMFCTLGILLIVYRNTSKPESQNTLCLLGVFAYLAHIILFLNGSNHIEHSAGDWGEFGFWCLMLFSYFYHYIQTRSQLETD